MKYLYLDNKKGNRLISLNEDEFKALIDEVNKVVDRFEFGGKKIGKSKKRCLIQVLHKLQTSHTLENIFDDMCFRYFK